MSATLIKNRTALTGIAALFLAATLSATGVALAAPTLSNSFAANASEAVQGQVSLIGAVTDSGAGAFAGN